MTSDISLMEDHQHRSRFANLYRFLSMKEELTQIIKIPQIGEISLAYRGHDRDSISSKSHTAIL